ncbi:MAG TPA: hypothetical protein VF384_03445 [Planctomycetota bacterium]
MPRASSTLVRTTPTSPLARGDRRQQRDPDDVKKRHLPLLALVLVAAAAPAQTVPFGDPDPSTLNGLPWGVATGSTSLHVYSASLLRAWGVCGGAQLVDLSIAAATSGSGAYHAPQCTLAIGHLLVYPPVPGAWTNHLDAPAIVHDLASGPFTFGWTHAIWNPLPGVAAAGFVWDGQRDIGVLLSTSPGTTGTFLSGTSGGLRHHVALFGATTQAPTVLHGYAMAAQFTFAPTSLCATKALLGAGCYDGAYSFYQQFTGLPAFDLAGSAANPRTVLAIPVPAGYHVANGASAWFAPGGPQVLNNSPVPGPMQDDSMSGPLVLPFTFQFPGGSTNVVHAAANGFVVLGPTAAASSTETPSTSALRSGQPRLAPLWCDLDPARNLPSNPAAGIYFDVDPGNQAVYVTWLDVADGGSVPLSPQSHINLQCVLHANGVFEYRYGAFVSSPSLFPTAVLVGWSQGNSLGANARMLGPVDISAAIPFATNGPDSWRLGLDSNLPMLGTTLTLTVSNVENLVPLAFFTFGDTQIPGIDLGFLGAPGCSAYTSANLLWASAPVTFGAGSLGTGALAVALPDAQPLVGLPLFTQAIAFTFHNSLHLATSNGLALQLGR